MRLTLRQSNSATPIRWGRLRPVSSPIGALDPAIGGSRQERLANVVMGDRHASHPLIGYPKVMSKTSVEVDQDIVRQAAAILGTRTLRETIDAALRDVVNAKRRLELIALLSEEGRFDFDAGERAWGGDT